MIETIQFRDFKVLRDATLPLGRFTLIVGPNGSGKTTALQGFRAARSPGDFTFDSVAYAGALNPGFNGVDIIIKWAAPYSEVETRISWSKAVKRQVLFSGPGGVNSDTQQAICKILERIRVYSLDSQKIALPVQLVPDAELQSDGGNLAAVLDRLRDQDEKRFEALNEALGNWLPEFDRVLFETPASGTRAFALRTRNEGYKIKATDLSQGTLLALAMLTLAYLPDPPSIVCVEEPDRGIHPRLLREVQDVFYRLSYPENYGEQREPVQVIATTHSPYLLDLFRDYPDQVVIAQKTEEGAKFERLSEQPYIEEILRDSPALGDIWYTGVLGGVPSYA
jgi:predicted ATPase